MELIAHAQNNNVTSSAQRVVPSSAHTHTLINQLAEWTHSLASSSWHNDGDSGPTSRGRGVLHPSHQRQRGRPRGGKQRATAPGHLLHACRPRLPAHGHAHRGQGSHRGRRHPGHADRAVPHHVLHAGPVRRAHCRLPLPPNASRGGRRSAGQAPASPSPSLHLCARRAGLPAPAPAAAAGRLAGWPGRAAGPDGRRWREGDGHQQPVPLPPHASRPRRHVLREPRRRRCLVHVAGGGEGRRGGVAGGLGLLRQWRGLRRPAAATHDAVCRALPALPRQAREEDASIVQGMYVNSPALSTSLVMCVCVCVCV